MTHQRAGRRLDQEVLGVGVVEPVYGGTPAGAAADLVADLLGGARGVGEG
ncbi:hypothetical protein [Streptomyces sp. NPDC001601]